MDTKIKFNSYSEALDACQKISQKGYLNDELVKVVIQKNINLRSALNTNPKLDLLSLRILTALGLCRSGDTLNVLDFGGGGGAHHAIASKAYGDSIKPVHSFSLPYFKSSAVSFTT